MKKRTKKLCSWAFCGMSRIVRKEPLPKPAPKTPKLPIAATRAIPAHQRQHLAPHRYQHVPLGQQRRLRMQQRRIPRPVAHHHARCRINAPMAPAGNVRQRGRIASQHRQRRVNTQQAGPGFGHTLRRIGRTQQRQHRFLHALADAARRALGSQHILRMARRLRRLRTGRRQHRTHMVRQNGPMHAGRAARARHTDPAGPPGNRGARADRRPHAPLERVGHAQRCVVRLAFGRCHAGRLHRVREPRKADCDAK